MTFMLDTAVEDIPVLRYEIGLKDNILDIASGNTKLVHIRHIESGTSALWGFPADDLCIRKLVNIGGTPISNLEEAFLFLTDHFENSPFDVCVKWRVGCFYLDELLASAKAKLMDMFRHNPKAFMKMEETFWEGASV